MKLLDLGLDLLIPAIILLHLVIAPYTKVEESFNIQAVHDLLHWTSFPSVQSFDHVEFSGAVPRTFVGASVLSVLSKPILLVLGTQNGVYYAQFVVRAVLGLINAAALVKYRKALDKSFTKGVGRWWVLLQATQFHVLFYASRTLPNMLAFPLRPQNKQATAKGLRRGIFLFVFAGVVFRSEIALLLFTQLLIPLYSSDISLQDTIQTGFQAALLALVVSCPIDSFFWQRPIWPEFAGFYYNAIQGKSSEWGTSPYWEYFTSLLPKLILNPFIFVLIILALGTTGISRRVMYLTFPPLLFTGIYSLQPHKEARFIIYIVPSLTAAGSLAANWIWVRRSKNNFYRIGSLVLILSIAGTFVASTTMLLISSLNYPGGEALSLLHSSSLSLPTSQPLQIHMDVLSCMTGVTQFGQSNPLWTYDKSESPDTLLDPLFWNQFDYLLMAEPGKAIGAWEVVDTIYSYAGVELLRPGQKSVAENPIESAYAANNESGVLSSEEVQDAVEHEVLEENKDAKSERSFTALKRRFREERLTRVGIYMLVRDGVRSFTGGWWIGPKLEPAVRILRKASAV